MKQLVALRPALVIGSVPFKAETVARFLEQPFAFLALNPRTLVDIENDIRLLARLTTRKPAGDRLIRRMRRAFAELRRRRPQLRRRLRVYCEAWPNPRISSPPWVAELVEICGGHMVVPPGERIEDEQVAAAKPELIILAWAATGAKANPGRAYNVASWKDIPAIQNRCVQVIRDELLNTPGPPLIEGAEVLWNAIHQTRK
jgi:iron complex transport system substrate-binding protein